MRSTFLLVLFTLLSITCGNAQETPTLKEQIDNYFASGRVGKDPMILLDNKEVEGALPDINAYQSYRITVLHKNEARVIEKYGEDARDGVIMIFTGEEEFRPKPDEGVLFLINGEPVAREVVESMNPDRIESLEVIKDPEVIATYTDVPYKGIVLVILKK